MRNQCLYPLQTLRSQVEKQASVAHIFQAQDEAREEVDAALVRIEDAVPRRCSGEKRGRISPMSRRRRVVKVAPLSTKTYLETQADVDEFLNKLRQELEAAIKADERVEIL